MIVFITAYAPEPTIKDRVTGQKRDALTAGLRSGSEFEVPTARPRSEKVTNTLTGTTRRHEATENKNRRTCDMAGGMSACVRSSAHHGKPRSKGALVLMVLDKGTGERDFPQWSIWTHEDEIASSRRGRTNRGRLAIVCFNVSVVVGMKKEKKRKKKEKEKEKKAAQKRRGRGPTAAQHFFLRGTLTARKVHLEAAKTGSTDALRCCGMTMTARTAPSHHARAPTVTGRGQLQNGALDQPPAGAAQLHSGTVSSMNVLKCSLSRLTLHGRPRRVLDSVRGHVSVEFRQVLVESIRRPLSARTPE